MLDNLFTNLFDRVSSIWDSGGDLLAEALTGMDLLESGNSVGNSAAGEKIVDEAKKFLGRTKSQMGGMDCSAFVRYVAEKTGSSLEQYIEEGKGPNGCSRLLDSMERISEDEARNGDLVFFKLDSGGLKTATHVGILVVGEDGIRQVLSMTNSGVRIDDFNDIAIRGTKITWGDRVVTDGYARFPQHEQDYPAKGFA